MDGFEIVMIVFLLVIAIYILIAIYNQHKSNDQLGGVYVTPTLFITGVIRGFKQSGIYVVFCKMEYSMEKVGRYSNHIQAL